MRLISRRCFLGIVSFLAILPKAIATVKNIPSEPEERVAMLNGDIIHGYNLLHTSPRFTVLSDIEAREFLRAQDESMKILASIFSRRK